MNVLDQARHVVSDHLFHRSITRHRSRLGWRDAPRFTKDWEACRRAMSDPLPDRGVLEPAIGMFECDGVASFCTSQTTAIAKQVAQALALREAEGDVVWHEDHDAIGNRAYAGDAWLDFPELEDLFRGDLGVFLQHYFGCHFRIWYVLLYRNVPNREMRIGSQRWHSDSGPGSCVNVMFYIDETSPENGPLEALPWRDALMIYRTERAALRRAEHRVDQAGDRFGALYDYYMDEIEAHYADRVVQPCGPAGLVVPFLNNTLHRGGFPKPGFERTALVCHCYPARYKTPFEDYRSRGLAKSGSYPIDPRIKF